MNTTTSQDSGVVIEKAEKNSEHVFAYRVRSVVLKVGSESFVEPAVIPPLRSDEISEPLVTEFVRDQSCYHMFVFDAGHSLLVQHEFLSETDSRARVMLRIVTDSDIKIVINY